MQTAEKSSFQRLAGALEMQLPEGDAEKMALLIHAALPDAKISIENMPLTGDDIHEYLIFAFSERILIPVRPRQPGSSSWDRVLKFAPKEVFFMPGVARILFENASSTGIIDAECAVREAIPHHPDKFIDDTICFLKRMRSQTDSCMAEAGFMSSVVQKIALQCELYDIIDNCVAAGIMNPCSQGAAAQRPTWFEFHPCLYWDPRFE